MYRFDYSKRGGMTEEEFRDALWETYCDTEPVRREVCESKELLDIQQEDIVEIDRTAKWSSKHVSYDAGQRALYVCDPAFEMIELRSIGDVERELQDKTAKKLCKYYDRVVGN